MTEIAVIATLTVVFVVAALLLIATSRTGLPVIPFYLLAGVAMGWWVDEGHVLELAQWGIAFLVFAFAVEVEPLGESDLQLDAAVIGVVQVAVTGVLLYAVTTALGVDPLTALFLAVAGSLSSTLVGLGHLRKHPTRPTVTHERLGETIHFVEDFVAIGIVLVLSAVVYANGGVGDADGGELSRVAAGIGLLVAGLVVRAFVFERIATLASDDVEILMLTGLSILIGFIALAEAAGISVVVGAFAAGLALPHEYPHDVDMLDAIDYVEDFFVPIFFVTMGALVTVPGLETLGLAALLYLAVVAVNPVIVAGLAYWRGYDSRSATLTGLDLDQVSEFSLIIAIEALLVGVLAREVFDAIVLAAVASMITSTYSHDYGSALYKRLVDLGAVGADLEDVADRSTVPDGISDHVLVVGYGPLGKQIAEAAGDAGHETVVIEADPTLVEDARASADYHVWGDALADSTWTLARPEAAALIVSTAPDPERTRRTIRQAGDTDVIVHADDPRMGREYVDEGALFTAVPEVLAGEHLAEHVERALTEDGYRDVLEETGREAVERAMGGS